MMKTTMKSVLTSVGLAVSTTLALSACASMPPGSVDEAAKLELYRSYAGEEISGIPMSSRIHQWTDLGERALAVWTSPGRAYLLELKSDCRDLEYAHSIGFDSMDSRLDAGFDSVLVLSEPEPRIPCRIDTIQEIDVQALRAAEKVQDSGT